MSTQPQDRDNVVALPSRPEPSEDKSYQPGSPYKIVVIGALIILAAFGGFGIWAATAPLDSASLAPGTVTVESNRKIVKHLDGGVVQDILISDGQYVKEGEVVLRLDPTEAAANETSIRQQLDAALALRARLIAERDGLDRIPFPEELTSRRDSSPAVREAMAGERRQFVERRRSIEGQIAIQEEKIAQLRQEIAGLRAQRDSLIRQADILRNELVDMRALNAQGYFPTSRILAMERELARLEGEIGSNAAGIARAQKGISEARMQIRQIRQQFDEKVVSQLREVENRIAELRQKHIVAQERLKRTVIRAPHSGVVQNLQIHTEGGVIRPGEELMQIIPANDRLVIEAEVPPRDIDVVAEGQRAEVRMSAFKSRTTPVLYGKVVTVSADRIVDEQQQKAYYKARVEIPPEELKKLGGRKLQAGMPAEVLINTGERTMLQYLIKPLTDAMARGFIEQ